MPDGDIAEPSGHELMICLGLLGFGITFKVTPAGDAFGV